MSKANAVLTLYKHKLIESARDVKCVYSEGYNYTFILPNNTMATVDSTIGRIISTTNFDDFGGSNEADY
jgi:hypothetical protein